MLASSQRLNWTSAGVDVKAPQGHRRRSLQERAQPGDFVVPSTRLTLRDRAFSVAASRA